MAYPNVLVPTNVPVHPTPVYEALAMSGVPWILWHYRIRPWATNGGLMGLYLVLTGIERFLVEFLRTNPRSVFGLTVAQVTSIVAVAAGISILAVRRNAEPPPGAGRARVA